MKVHSSNKDDEISEQFYWLRSIPLKIDKFLLILIYLSYICRPCHKYANGVRYSSSSLDYINSVCHILSFSVPFILWDVALASECFTVISSTEDLSWLHVRQGRWPQDKSRYELIREKDASG